MWGPRLGRAESLWALDRQIDQMPRGEKSIQCPEAFRSSYRVPSLIINPRILEGGPVSEEQGTPATSVPAGNTPCPVWLLRPRMQISQREGGEST
jgi:hypothetical protein